MENTVKKCTMCERLLTLDHFKKVNFSADGHAAHCKDCGKKKRIAKVEARCEDGEIVKDVRISCNPELAKFHARELMEELWSRGYAGKLRITREVDLEKLFNNRS